MLTSTSYICFLSLTFVLTRPDMTTTSHWEMIEIFMKDSGQIKVNEKIITMDLLNNYTQYSGPHQWRVERLSLFIQAIYPVCTKQESLSLFSGSFLKTENATVPFNLSSLISLRKAYFKKKPKKNRTTLKQNTSHICGLLISKYDNRSQLSLEEMLSLSSSDCWHRGLMQRDIHRPERQKEGGAFAVVSAKVRGRVLFSV